MKWFKDLSCFSKLMIGFGFLGLITALTGWFGISQLDTMKNTTDAIYKRQQAPLVALGDIQDDLQRIRQDSYKMFTPIDVLEVKAVVEEARKLDLSLIERIDKFMALLSSEDERAGLTRFREAAARYRQHREDNQYRPLLGGQKETGLQGAKDGAPLYEAAVRELKATIRARQTTAQKEFEDAASSVYSSSQTTLLVLVMTGLLLGQLLGFWIARLIARPLRNTVAILEGVAGGDLTKRVAVDSKDEVGQMSAALNRALERMGHAVQSIGHNALTLGGSAEELSAVSAQMSASAEETSAQTTSVSAAAGQVSGNSQAVAAATEQMGNCIREIAKNSSEAARVATTAVTMAATTNATIAQLGESSAEIGQVIKVITSIAQQTNLLALNATIEAARAGEAGKGFAVVANEVKELAKGTARATEDISQKIEAIQRDTRGAVEAIGQIVSVINQINDYQNTIASAVEEQTATTNEIGRNVSDAAKGSAEIARNIESVALAAQSTTEGAANMKEAVMDLARMAAGLQQLVAQFKVSQETAGSSPESKAEPVAMPRLETVHRNGRSKALART